LEESSGHSVGVTATRHSVCTCDTRTFRSLFDCLPFKTSVTLYSISTTVSGSKKVIYHAPSKPVQRTAQASARSPSHLRVGISRRLVDLRAVRHRGIREPQVPHGRGVFAGGAAVVQLHRVMFRLLAVLDVQAQGLVGDWRDPESVTARQSKSVPSPQEECPRGVPLFDHIPVSAGAVAEGDDAPADSAVRRSEGGGRAETFYLRAICHTFTH
jgi:hypothetical protein